MRLYAVNTHTGIHLFNGKGHAADETTAADGHHHHIYILQLIQDLQTDGTLTGNHIFIIKGMNKSVAFLLFQLQRFFVSVIIHALDQAHLGAIALGGLHLTDGRAVRQANQRLNTILGSSQRHALGMVTGGAGNHAPRLFLIGQLADLIVGATNLKRTGDLQIFCF